jgi:GNAT superfamily N-acetyltransferase
MTETGSVLIRRIGIADAEAVAELSGELGYPADCGSMKDRIEGLIGRDNHAVFVACVEGAVIGWIDVAAVRHLQVEPYAEIGGLVVSSRVRSSGIGKRLVEEAERWAAGRGFGRIVVRSRVEREGAHRFYLREGYQQTKTSAIFSKSLR